jgi:aminomethyltransferase
LEAPIVLRTPLYDWHVKHSGKMVDFAGWEMPLLYNREGQPSGITEEHHQVRKSGGIFDVSHMGRVKVTGRHSRRFLERLCTRRVSDMTGGQCRYSLVCNDRGGVRDDVLVYKFDDDDWMLVVNASNREKLLGHFDAIKGDLVVKIDDQTKSTAMVAIQGPKVMELIGKFSREVPTLKRYRFATKNLLIVKLIISRTGYTGEDGVEVILPANMVGMAMGLVLKDVDITKPDALLKPAGLGARDTLRLEAGMPLYGHELGEEVDALACGLDFAMNLDKDQDERGEKFIGFDALKKIKAEGGPRKKLVGLMIDGKRTARQSMNITKGGKVIGVVTSGCLSPTLGASIAMGYVERECAENGTALTIDTGKGATLEAKVSPMPFYKVGK